MASFDDDGDDCDLTSFSDLFLTLSSNDRGDRRGLVDKAPPPFPPLDSFELFDRVRERKNVNERFSLGELRCVGDKFILDAVEDKFSFYF